MLKTSYCIIASSDSTSSDSTSSDSTNEIVREIGVDEAGRGPMLGRVYTAAVVLPPDCESFNHALMKDSKKFHSEKKIRAASEYNKEKAIAWAIAYSDEKVIDEINIRNATHRAMHDSIANVITSFSQKGGVGAGPLLLIDGNDFTPFIKDNKRIQHVCIEGGDNTYSCIAAASILAKVARDDYIAELCKQEPSLIEHYDLLKNKGYGKKKHMDGIRAHGITRYHRKTFGLCRDFA